MFISSSQHYFPLKYLFMLSVSWRLQTSHWIPSHVYHPSDQSSESRSTSSQRTRKWGPLTQENRTEQVKMRDKAQWADRKPSIERSLSPDCVSICATPTLLQLRSWHATRHSGKCFRISLRYLDFRSSMLLIIIQCISYSKIRASTIFRSNLLKQMKVANMRH